MKLIDSIILFSGLAFLVMWVNEFIYKHASFKDSYFFLMFSVALFLGYVYRRGQFRMEQKKQAENLSSKKNIRPTIENKTKQKKQGK